MRNVGWIMDMVVRKILSLIFIDLRLKYKMKTIVKYLMHLMQNMQRKLKISTINHLTKNMIMTTIIIDCNNHFIAELFGCSSNNKHD